jgi:hypothetical protein
MCSKIFIFFLLLLLLLSKLSTHTHTHTHTHIIKSLKNKQTKCLDKMFADQFQMRERERETKRLIYKHRSPFVKQFVNLRKKNIINKRSVIRMSQTLSSTCRLLNTDLVILKRIVTKNLCYIIHIIALNQSIVNRKTRKL